MAQSRSRRPALRLAALVVAAIWIAAQPASSSAEDVMDLDLEDLLELDVNLNAMGLTGIHHAHVGREWMVGYQFTSMLMRGNRQGTSSRSTAQVLSDFMVTPTEMSMQMHMLDVMYAPNDDWTLMGMIPWTRLSMEHQTRTGVRFATQSQGFGDLKLNALYSLWRSDSEARTDRIILKGGTSIPTGSINQRDRTPSGRATLPYPMQLGSGTFDLLPGLTYVGQTDRWSWGSHLGGTVRFHENRKDYQLGNQGQLEFWAARKLASWLSASIRLRGQVWGNIHGADSRLNPAMVPTADPDLRRGRSVDLSVGSNLFALSGPLRGNRIAVEVGVPIYQSLEGPQLERDLRIGLSWTFTFVP